MGRVSEFRTSVALRLASLLGTREPLRVPSIFHPSCAKNPDQCRSGPMQCRSTINHNRAISDQAYYASTKRGQRLLSSIQNTPTKTGPDQIGPDWNGSDQTKPRWTESDRGPDQTGQDRTGPDRPDRADQTRPDQTRVITDHTKVVKLSIKVRVTSSISPTFLELEFLFYTFLAGRKEGRRR